MTRGITSTSVQKFGIVNQPGRSSGHNKMRFVNGGMGAMTVIASVFAAHGSVYMSCMSTTSSTAAATAGVPATVTFNCLAYAVIGVSIIIVAVKAKLIRRHGAAAGACSIVLLQNIVVL